MHEHILGYSGCFVNADIHHKERVIDELVSKDRDFVVEWGDPHGQQVGDVLNGKSIYGFVSHVDIIDGVAL